MNGNNSRSVMVQERMGQEVPAALQTPQAQQFLEVFAGKVAEKVVPAVVERVRQEIAPRMDEMERKVEAATRRVDAPTPPPLRERENEQGVLRRALDRVD